MDIEEYTAMAGERIQNWIEQSLTRENDCKRDEEEEDSFEDTNPSWVFTQKGQKLYESYLSKVEHLIDKKYPKDTALDSLESHTGVIYP